MEFMTSGCCSMLRWICRRSAASCPSYSFDRCASAAHVAFKTPCAIPLACAPLPENALMSSRVGPEEMNCRPVRPSSSQCSREALLPVFRGPVGGLVSGSISLSYSWKDASAQQSDPEENSTDDGSEQRNRRDDADDIGYPPWQEAVTFSRNVGASTKRPAGALSGLQKPPVQSGRPQVDALCPPARVPSALGSNSAIVPPARER